MKFLFSTLLFFPCAVLHAQDNPFLEFANEPYSFYYEKLEELLYNDIESHDSDWAAQTAAHLRETAKKTKNKKWALEADYFEIVYGHFRNLTLFNNPTQTQIDSLAEIYIDKLKKIAPQAKKINAFDIELRSTYAIWKCYYDYVKNFEMSFRYCTELDKILTTVSVEEFPMRTYYYSRIGTQYYNFQDYETAGFYFEKGLENAEKEFNIFETIAMWNNLGLIYRNHYQDLEKSDSCFRRILDIKISNPQQPHFGVNPTNKDIYTRQDNYELWVGIAQGGLGTNCYLRGNYQEAIPLLILGMEKVTEHENPHNYPYAAQRALLLSEIFLATSDLSHVQLYSDKMYDFLDKSRKREIELDITKDIRLWMMYYDLMNRYCRLSGNYAHALLYVDSCSDARTKYEEDYNLRNMHNAAMFAKQQELDAEMLRNQIYYRNLMAISIFALLTLALLTLLYRLYRKKQAAYRELVRKSQEWAQATAENTTPSEREDAEDTTEHKTDTPDETDMVIMKEIERLLSEEKLYTDNSLSVDMIAQKLHSKKHYVSNAINRCTHMNFKTFVNEYRIKEAVKMISSDAKNLSLEGIAFELGYNDRKTFYTAFKKITGLSPSEFRSNLQRK